jgi:hypothetical protein
MSEQDGARTASDRACAAAAEDWRVRKGKSEGIPEELWKVAVEAARECGGILRGQMAAQKITSLTATCPPIFGAVDTPVKALRINRFAWLGQRDSQASECSTGEFPGSAQLQEQPISGDPVLIAQVMKRCDEFLESAFAHRALFVDPLLTLSVDIDLFPIIRKAAMEGTFEWRFSEEERGRIRAFLNHPPPRGSDYRLSVVSMMNGNFSLRHPEVQELESRFATP